MFEAKVLTVSDSVAAGRIEDGSGQALEKTLVGAGYRVVERTKCADGIEEVAAMLRELASEFTGLVVTTGGTGFGPRDLTPEATAAVLEREAPGLAEAIRQSDPRGRLTRGRAGTVGHCLVVNLPGSPGGAVDSLSVLLDVLPHVLELLQGGHPHPHGEVTSTA